MAPESIILLRGSGREIFENESCCKQISNLVKDRSLGEMRGLFRLGRI